MSEEVNDVIFSGKKDLSCSALIFIFYNLSVGNGILKQWLVHSLFHSSLRVSSMPVHKTYICV